MKKIGIREKSLKLRQDREKRLQKEQQIRLKQRQELVKRQPDIFRERKFNQRLNAARQVTSIVDTIIHIIGSIVIVIINFFTLRSILKKNKVQKKIKKIKK